AILLADRVIPLNPGPRAALGPSFKVAIPRPRDRAALNASDAFIDLRRDITEYLMSVRVGRAGDAEREIVLPKVVPISRHRGTALPGAYVEAAKSPTREGYVEFSGVS